MNNTKIRKIRTVRVNERGQIVIPEDIREDFGISGETTLIIVERKGEIILKREIDVLEAIEGEDNFWKELSRRSMKRAWSKEDVVWDRAYKEGSR